MIVEQTFHTWINRPKPNSQTRLRLFCFPCAGGTTSAYSKWQNNLPTDIELCLIQLPGRSYRLDEPHFTQFPLLVKKLTYILKPYLNIPFAFFGHSMGATLAFEIARQLRRDGYPIPVKLFTACCPPPHRPIQRPFIHELPENEFVAELQRRYNAIPETILQNQELVQIFLPSLRADFTMIETYAYATEKPLECSIAAFGGLQDKAISLQEIQEWQIQTTSHFNLEMFTGGHFFLHDYQSSFLELFSLHLSELLAMTPTQHDEST
jgi:medium-chain acyl-[acyl-carrier-protein] hydrolase